MFFLEKDKWLKGMELLKNWVLTLVSDLATIYALLFCFFVLVWLLLFCVRLYGLEMGWIVNSAAGLAFSILIGSFLMIVEECNESQRSMFYLTAKISLFLAGFICYHRAIEIEDLLGLCSTRLEQVNKCCT